MVQSAMEEAGNIFLNECMKTLGQELKIEIYPSTPRLEQGPWEKIWNRLALSQLSMGDDVLALCGDFSWAQSQRLGQFFLCLSQDSWERFRHWAARGQSLITTVGLGALDTANAPTLLRAADLGSCVALVMYDSIRKIGAMAHVVLPRAPSAQVAHAKPGKYADYAVSAMMKRLRGPRFKPSVWIVGGADMLMPFVSSLGSIGTQNAEALRQELKREGLKLEGEDIGGTQARTVELLTDTGELWIKWGQRQRREQMGR
jgi:chemotaxis protein CheD